MKKAISLLFAILLMTCLTIPAYAQTDDKSIVSILTDDGVDFTQLQRLFPDIALREDGFIDDYTDNISAYSDSQTKQLTETHTADYINGTCNLNIYSDGSYSTYGIEQILDSPISRTSTGPGYSITGSTYKAYYNMFDIGVQQGFSYTFTVSSGSGYSTISKLSSVNVYGGIQQGYFSARSSNYVLQKQVSSSKPAEVYGDAEYYHMSYSNGTFRLISKADRGKVSVSFAVL